MGPVSPVAVRVAAEDWRLHWEPIYKPRLGNVSLLGKVVAHQAGGLWHPVAMSAEALPIRRWA